MLLAVLSLGISSMVSAGADGQSCAAVAPQLRKAEQALHDDDADGADLALTPFIAVAENCPQILLLLGRAKAAERMPTLARDLLTRYTNQVHNNPLGFVFLARTMLEQRDRDGATTAVDQALKLDPRNVDALLLKGELLESKGRTGHAETAFTQAATIEPANIKATYQLATFFDRHHSVVQAVQAFRAVIKLDPNNPFAWDYLALNLELAGQSPAAEAAFQSGLAVNQGPQIDRFLDYNFGRFLVKWNRLAESKSYLDRAVANSPTVRAVYYERAKLNLLLGNLSGSKDDLQQALALADPGQYIQDVQLYALMATVFGRLGNLAQAHQYAELARSTKLRSANGGRQ